MLRPFRIGEDVEVGPLTGTVQEIGLFATRLRREDGVYQLAPNATLWNQPVSNFTRNGVRRNDIVVSIAQGDDVDEAQRALLSIATADARVKKQPPATAFISELGAVKMTLRYWTAASDFFAVSTDLMKAVEHRFYRRGDSQAAA